MSNRFTTDNASGRVPSALSTQCKTNLEHSHALSTQCRLTCLALALSATDLLGSKVPVRALCVVLNATVLHYFL